MCKKNLLNVKCNLRNQRTVVCTTWRNRQEFRLKKFFQNRPCGCRWLWSILADINCGSGSGLTSAISGNIYTARNYPAFRARFPVEVKSCQLEDPAVKSTVSVSVLLGCFLLSSFSFAHASDRVPAGASNSPDTSAISAQQEAPPATSQFVIPGPRRSFLRLAGISQKVTPEEVLPLLSRNVFTEGYQGSSRVNEFLILLRRYVVQARELASLAAQTGMVLRVSNCNEAAPLLRILGYRTQPNCGDPNTSLQTEDPERAFLAIDSGFPLPALERALQGGKAFEYPYSSEPVPVLFAESEWTQLSKKNLRENSRDLLDTILYDPSIARLYWAFSRIDP